MSAAMTDLIIRGKLISQDADGYLSLTDMWRVSGAEEYKSPWRWRALPNTSELTRALCQNHGFSEVIRKSRTESALYSKPGKGGGTYAHIILALAYAEYLDPELGIEVREIALRVWAGDVSVLDDFKKARYDQAREDESRTSLREEIQWSNQVLNAIVEEIGVKHPGERAKFHNSGYEGLYDGETENDIHKRKGLKKGQAILDFMSSAEAAANWFRTTQAEQRLRLSPVKSVKDACVVHRNVGKRVRDFMKEMGGPMPEDMPVVDSISEAKKRLRAYRKSRKNLK